MDKKCLIAVMSPTGSGKSSFIKGITGRQDIKVGHTLLSGTVSSPHTLSRVISFRSIETDCIQSYDGIISLTAITLIDTPGFDDSSVADLEILRALSKWLKEHCEEGQLLTGIIYLHP
jgi:predicted GTPase